MASGEVQGSGTHDRAETVCSFADMQAHVARILDSAAFVRAPRMQRFVSFLVEEFLAGRAENLKEYSIALSVFDKPADFDPGTSAVIRVEAGRLRRMLAQYRAEPGRDDEMVLEVPKGSYVPHFRRATPGSRIAEELLRIESHEHPGSEHPEQSDRKWMATDERRLVTVISCAFGDERHIADYSIANDFLSSFDVFHGLCSTIAQRHGGTVDGGASDRLIVYFGWPEALEDAAGRALTAALEMVAAVREALGQDTAGARVGVATSEVVIRAPSDSSAEIKPAVIGQAPVLATAMLQQTPLNGVLVAEQTRGLTGNAFNFVPAGSAEGQERESALLWRLLGRRPVTTRFRAQHGPAENAIIGRREEIALIESRWRLSLEGEGQAVIIIGEAGIGKSILAESTLALIGADGATLRLQCSPHHANSTLYPFVELLRSLVVLGEDHGENDINLGRFIAACDLDSPQNRALLAALLSRPYTAELGALSASQQKDLTLGLLTRWLAAQARNRPTALLVEDLHWGDPTTLELLQQIVGFAADMRLLIILTSRHDVAASFAQRTSLTSLRLARLPKGDCNTLISELASAAPLSAATRAAILDKAEGVPLFLEELTRLFLGADMLCSTSQQVPASLSDLLASQLGRLGSSRGIAQIAAVIGRQFSREMLELATGRPTDDVDAALDRLLAAGIIVRSGPDSATHYRFRHALLRDAAYGSILEHPRRQLHGRVASLIVEGFPEIAAEHPEVVAGHFMDAAEYSEAIPFWVDAASQAAGRYALAEAITDYRHALDALGHLPPGTANSERELEVLIALGQVVRGAHGYGDEELQAIYDRARVLAGEVGDRLQLANAIYGLWTHAAGRGQWPTAVLLAGEFEALTLHSEDTQLTVEAYRLLGASAAFRGEFPLALHHFERAMESYDLRLHGPGYGFDPGAASAAYLAWIRWHAGDR